MVFKFFEMYSQNVDSIVENLNKTYQAFLKLTNKVNNNPMSDPSTEKMMTA